MKKLLAGGMAVACATVLCANEVRADAVPVTDHLVVHLDAADASSLTLNGDVVNEWRSSVGSYSLKAGAIVYPEAPFQKNDVTLVTENGRQGLRFSHYEGANEVYAVMSFGDGVRVSAKTFFFVTRQIDSRFYGAIMGGDPSTYNERLRRNDAINYSWSGDNYSRVLTTTGTRPLVKRRLRGRLNIAPKTQLRLAAIE